MNLPPIHKKTQEKVSFLSPLSNMLCPTRLLVKPCHYDEIEPTRIHMHMEWENWLFHLTGFTYEPDVIKQRAHLSSPHFPASHKTVDYWQKLHHHHILIPPFWLTKPKSQTRVRTTVCRKLLCRRINAEKAKARAKGVAGNFYAEEKTPKKPKPEPRVSPETFIPKKKRRKSQSQSQERSHRLPKTFMRKKNAEEAKTQSQACSHRLQKTFMPKKNAENQIDMFS